MKSQRARKNERKGGTTDRVRDDQRKVRMEVNNVSSQVAKTMRKLTTVGTISTNASGFIAATQINSDGARSTNGFASFAARYLQFRVKAIQVTLIPIVDVTTAVSAGGGAVTPHPTALYFAKFMEGLGYVNVSAIADGQERKLFNGRERMIVYAVDWTNCPEARLWAATNGAVPTAQQFGIQFQDTAVAPASAASTVYYRALTEYLVEFQTTA